MTRKRKPSKAGPTPGAVSLHATDRDGDAAQEHFDVYTEYANTLRVWLVSYGIGAPVLLFTNELFSERVLDSGSARLVAILFLSGVGAQVFLALLNKNAMWACYYGSDNPSFKATRRYKLADWLSRQYWIDLVLDAGTFLLFGIATWRAVAVAAGTT